HILDDELLPERAREVPTDDAANNVGRSTGSERNDHCDRPRRYSLRKQSQQLALSQRHKSRYWRQKLFPRSVTVGGRGEFRGTAPEAARVRLCCRDGGDPMSTGPTFVATFADGVVTRMSVYAENETTPDLERGKTLARYAYESRAGKP